MKEKGASISNCPILVGGGAIQAYIHPRYRRVITDFDIVCTFKAEHVEMADVPYGKVEYVQTYINLREKEDAEVKAYIINSETSITKCYYARINIYIKINNNIIPVTIHSYVLDITEALRYKILFATWPQRGKHVFVDFYDIIAVLMGGLIRLDDLNLPENIKIRLHAGLLAIREHFEKFTEKVRNYIVEEFPKREIKKYLSKIPTKKEDDSEFARFYELTIRLLYTSFRRVRVRDILQQILKEVGYL